MGTNTNITNLVLLTALSSCVITLDYDNFQNIAPTETTSLRFNDSRTWSYNSKDLNNDYSSYNSEDQVKIDVIVKFSQELVSQNIGLDSEFSKIVDDNFWDLL